MPNRTAVTTYRQFMNQTPFGPGAPRIPMWGPGDGALMAAFGELRGVMGLHVAKLAALCEIASEDDLASILPEASDTA